MTLMALLQTVTGLGLVAVGLAAVEPVIVLPLLLAGFLTAIVLTETGSDSSQPHRDLIRTGGHDQTIPKDSR